MAAAEEMPTTAPVESVDPDDPAHDTRQARKHKMCTHNDLKAELARKPWPADTRNTGAHARLWGAPRGPCQAQQKAWLPGPSSCARGSCGGSHPPCGCSEGGREDTVRRAIGVLHFSAIELRTCT